MRANHLVELPAEAVGCPVNLLHGLRCRRGRAVTDKTGFAADGKRPRQHQRRADRCLPFDHYLALRRAAAERANDIGFPIRRAVRRVGRIERGLLVAIIRKLPLDAAEVRLRGIGRNRHGQEFPLALEADQGGDALHRVAPNGVGGGHHDLRVGHGIGTGILVEHSQLQIRCCSETDHERRENHQIELGTQTHSVLPAVPQSTRCLDEGGSIRARATRPQCATLKIVQGANSKYNATSGTPGNDPA